MPVEIANRLNFKEGEILEIDTGPDSIVVRRARLAYQLDQLFAGHSPEGWRTIYAGAYDWGPDVGREVVDE